MGPDLLKKFCCIVVGGVSVLCLSTLSRAAAGAGYVDTKACLECHEQTAQGYEKNTHAKVQYWDAAARGCESCHGPGSSHAGSGDPTDIVNPAKLPADNAVKICLTCHENSAGQRYWWGSAHQAQQISCLSCHSVHGSNEKMLHAGTEAQTCFKCHPEQRSYMLKRSTHPVRDSSRSARQGKLSCSSCHNPHGTQTDKLIAANSVNDKCYECHQEMKAPVLWEHSPVKENCLNCHNPHGSNHEKMLTFKQPRLCQQCHEQGRHQSLSGAANSFFVINRGCSNCHAQIHGSNHPSGQKLKR